MTTLVEAYSVTTFGGLWVQAPITAPPVMLMNRNEALRSLAVTGTAVVDGAVLLAVRAALGVVPEQAGEVTA